MREGFSRRAEGGCKRTEETYGDCRRAVAHSRRGKWAVVTSEECYSLSSFIPLLPTLLCEVSGLGFPRLPPPISW